MRGNLSNEIKDDESRLLIQLVSTHYTEYILFLGENNISNVFVHSNESLPFVSPQRIPRPKSVTAGRI